MIIGVPREIKEHEYRVGITPEGAAMLTQNGHLVIVEESAGAGSGFSDEDYRQSGARISDKTNLFDSSELIIKVKEPLSDEYDLLRDGQALFTFLHLAPNVKLLGVLLKKKIAAFAYETLEVDGTLPLLLPMSEIAGKMSPVMGAYYQQRIHAGGGILLTGAEGVPPAQVVILGAGTVGMNALKVVVGMGAYVTVLNRGQEKLRIIEEQYHGRVTTLVSTKENIDAEVLKADVVICAVLIPGALAPKLISRELVSKMKKGSVIIDVAVDQGGCAETTTPTTHNNPIYSVDGVIHYAVANMPGAYPKTSTLALTNRTLPYIKILADSGIENAIKENDELRTALNIYKGSIMNKALAESVAKQ